MDTSGIQSTNVLELIAAWFALKSFESLVSGKPVLIQMNDQTAVIYVDNVLMQKTCQTYTCRYGSGVGKET